MKQPEKFQRVGMSQRPPECVDTTGVVVRLFVHNSSKKSDEDIPKWNWNSNLRRQVVYLEF